MNDFFKQLDGMTQDDAASSEERVLLYALVRNLKPAVCLEIGTHRGVSTLAIAKALQENGGGVVHTIDPIDWEAYRNWDKMPEQKKFIEYHKIGSEDFELDNIDFIFCDGLHEYEVVEMEIKRYFPKLNRHAIVVFHDCGGDNPSVGVNGAIADAGLQTAFIQSSNCLRIYGR